MHYFVSSGAPEEYFDAENEKQQELLDFTHAQMQGGFQYLTAPRDDAEGDDEFANMSLDELSKLPAGKARDSHQFFAEMEAILNGAPTSSKKFPPPTAFLDEVRSVLFVLISSVLFGLIP